MKPTKDMSSRSLRPPSREGNEARPIGSDRAGPLEPFAAAGRALLLAGATLLVFPSAVLAALHADRGSASFDASGPAGLRIQGKTTDISVSEAKESVRVTVALANLDTGIDLRNRHMREKYLEVPKYPTATLDVPRSALHFPEEAHEIGGSASGSMTIHGHSRPAVFTYKARRDHDAIDVTGTTHIDMNDFGIVVPSYLGITVKPGIDISVHFVAHDV
jgi:polyisoprenoid-binding protein YceI